MERLWILQQGQEGPPLTFTGDVVHWMDQQHSHLVEFAVAKLRHDAVEMAEVLPEKQNET